MAEVAAWAAGLEELQVAIARSQMGSEFTGPTFSPDGRILFAGIQKPGTLFAITGPW